MKKVTTVFLVLLCLALPFSLSATPSPGQSADTPQVSVIDMAPMLKKVMPAVVNIEATGKIQYPTSPFESLPNSPEQSPALPPGILPKEFRSFGSGVIVDAKKGYILTNAHVIREAQLIRVTLNDGRTFIAELIGTDPEFDIAVLKIDANNLTAVPFGNSETLQVGQAVVAIGSPFGLQQTATSGIISALGRATDQLGLYENFIQTDAAINLGNSGGALVNIKGELIGINTAIVSPELGNVGIGFAIPIDIAANILNQIITHGSVHRGLLGIFIQTVTPELASALNVPHVTGGIITQVKEGSAAQKAGLKVGDIVVQAHGKPIKNANDLRNQIALARVGDKIPLKVLRNNREFTLQPIIAERPATELEDSNQLPFLPGVTLRNIEEFSPAHGYIKGIQIIFIDENSPVRRYNVRPGDIIISANGHPVSTIAELKTAISKNNERLLLNLQRGSGALFVVIK